MLPRLQAEEQLARIEAASIVWMAADDRRDVFARLRRQYGDKNVVDVPTSRDLAAIGISVVEVDAEGRPTRDGTRSDTTDDDSKATEG